MKQDNHNLKTDTDILKQNLPSLMQANSGHAHQVSKLTEEKTQLSNRVEYLEKLKKKVKKVKRKIAFMEDSSFSSDGY